MSPLTLSELKKDFENLKNPEKAKLLMGFFKTGKGEYGEGDIFLGVMVPQQRQLAKKYKALQLSDIEKLLSSKIHEHRLTALIILVNQYGDKETSESEKKKIAKFYLKNTKYINNWDLVDLSSHHILGDYFTNNEKDRIIIYDLVKSKNLWERRIAILTTFFFIKNKKYDDSLKIAELLLDDEHDLIHKAVGWMLREIGKRDQVVEEQFLKKHYKRMPRTMLRYAIEKFDNKKKEFYMAKD